MSTNLHPMYIHAVTNIHSMNERVTSFRACLSIYLDTGEKEKMVYLKLRLR